MFAKVLRGRGHSNKNLLVHGRDTLDVLEKTSDVADTLLWG